MNIDRHRAQLIASLATNFLAKTPSILAVLIILPLIHRQMGEALYSKFLSALALAAVCGVPFGGVGVVGRRLIGAAAGENLKLKEADAVVSQVALASILGTLALISVLLVCIQREFSAPLMAACVIGVLAVFTNTFDNIRGAYNEHYITATLQFLMQLSAYAVAIIFPTILSSATYSSLVLQGPAVIASLSTFSMLLLARPYLAKGRPKHVGEMLRGGAIISIADGALIGSLNFSVFWYGSSGDAAYAAWYGTLCRLFLTFLTPVMLLLFPLGNYLNLKWGEYDQNRRNFISKTTSALSILYGAVVGFSMFLMSNFYLPVFMGIQPPPNLMDTIPIMLLFIAIVAQKSYASIAFLVLDGKRLSMQSAAIVIAGITIAFLSHYFVSSFTTVNVLALFMAPPLLLIIIYNSFIYSRHKH